MNVAQALAVAAAALLMAGEPVKAPLAHAVQRVADTPALSREAVSAAVEELAALFESRYVLPAQGAAYAAALRADARAGAYEGKSQEELAAALEARLSEVHSDRHLRVVAVTEEDGDPGALPSGADAFGQGAWFRDGVAYLPVRVFPDDAESQAHMNALLDSFAGAETLILDLRACFGGAMPVMDTLLSRLYDRPTHLVTVDFREDASPASEAEFASYASMVKVSAPQGVSRWEHWARPAANGATLADTRVIVLTGRTISACEHVALGLQRTERATLIGERTFGAGYYGDMVRFGDGLGGNLQVWVSFGRSYDPDTGESWEGVGVQPDVETPRANALEYALAAIRRAEAPPAPDASIHARRNPPV